MTNKPICIYHGGCFDGFAAAWAVGCAFGSDNLDFYPGVYQEAPPDVTNRDVIIVDFSYKAHVLKEMADKASSLLVLDHHKTAMNDLEFLPYAGNNFTDWQYNRVDRRNSGAVFDMDRSGCMITWQFFFDVPTPIMFTPPIMFTHIQDRDLWQFNYEETKAVIANLSSFPFDFNLWDDLMLMDQNDIFEFAREGKAILRKTTGDIDKLIEENLQWSVIDGWDVPVCNVPYMYASELANRIIERLSEENIPVHFAACYWDVDGYRNFSLRSFDGGIDVSEVAKKYGGGGHRNAAGFKIVKEDLSI